MRCFYFFTRNSYAQSCLPDDRRDLLKLHHSLNAKYCVEFDCSVSCEVSSYLGMTSLGLLCGICLTIFLRLIFPRNPYAQTCPPDDRRDLHKLLHSLNVTYCVEFDCRVSCEVSSCLGMTGLGLLCGACLTIFLRLKFTRNSYAQTCLPDDRRTRAIANRRSNLLKLHHSLNVTCCAEFDCRVSCGVSSYLGMTSLGLLCGACLTIFL